jgi:glycerate 2-kinase
MNILIACDSFKDALGALEVCQAIALGLKSANKNLNIRIAPLADGGEGFSAILHHHLGAHQVSLTVNNPLFRPTHAGYCISPDRHTAFIEMAQAAGLQHLTQSERNPLLTTTFGVGEMIQHAISQGATRIVLGLGGSATHDLGTGMAAALGWRFLNKNGQFFIPVGGSLHQISQILPPQDFPDKVHFEVMCDVTNPLWGEYGAAHVYAKQKGADHQAIQILEKGTIHFANLAQNAGSVDPMQAGCGAAGGMGYGAQLFLNASMKKGIDAILDLIGFRQQAEWADIIITGEGKLDFQTAQGKLISGLVAHCPQKRIIAFCGTLEASISDIKAMGLYAAFSIAQGPCTLNEALTQTAKNLETTAFQLGQLLCYPEKYTSKY